MNSDPIHGFPHLTCQDFHTSKYIGKTAHVYFSLPPYSLRNGIGLVKTTNSCELIEWEMTKQEPIHKSDHGIQS